LNYSAKPRNIPVGVYRVSATLIKKDGGKQALRCAPRFNGDWGDSAEIFWESDPKYQEDRVDPQLYVSD